MHGFGLDGALQESIVGGAGRYSPSRSVWGGDRSGFGAQRRFRISEVRNSGPDGHSASSSWGAAVGSRSDLSNRTEPSPKGGRQKIGFHETSKKRFCLK